MSPKGNPFNLLISKMDKCKTVPKAVLHYKEFMSTSHLYWYGFSKKKEQ
jgi:hypothetical protein